MDVKTVMITSDNRLTTAATGAGVDDFSREAPEANNVIRRYQAEAWLAMTGDSSCGRSGTGTERCRGGRL